MFRLFVLAGLLAPLPVAAQLTSSKPAPVAPRTASAAPSQPALVFDGDVGPFHVQATGGAVERTSDSTTLTGAVALWPNGRPDLRVSLSGGRVVLRARPSAGGTTGDKYLTGAERRESMSSGASAAGAQQKAASTYRTAASDGRVTSYEQREVGSADRNTQIASKQAEVDAARRDIAAIERRFAQDGKLTSAERDRLGQTRAKLAALQVELGRLRGQDLHADQYDTLSTDGLGALLVAFRTDAFRASLARANVSILPDATLGITAGDAPIRGCTHSAGSGSMLTGRDLVLVGTLRCGAASITSSTLRLGPTGVSGAGTLLAAGRSFSLAYGTQGSKLSASGAWKGASPGFQRVPGFDALEFQASSPELRVLVDGPGYRWQYDAAKIELRTVAKKPDGTPWARAEFDPMPIVTPAAPAPIPIPYPNLSHPGDPFRSTREACLAGATKAADNPATRIDERDAAVSACHVANPAPPAIPTLPASISVPIEGLIR